MSIPLNSVKNPDKIKLNFNVQSCSFFPELKKRVKVHFEGKQLNRTGDFQIFFKGLFFITFYIGCFFLILSDSLSPLLSLFVYAIMGSTAAAIGFNLMHDGAHGSFSGKKWINTIAAYSINLLGGDAVLWKNKHNMIHHTYTNIEGYDQDIAQMPVLRLNEKQKKYYLHKYQHIYCFLVYGLSSVLWIFLLDYIKYFSGKVGNIRMSSFTRGDHFIFWMTKIFYLITYLVIPAYCIGWPLTVAGFFIYHFVLGLTLSIVFQLAHVVQITDFPEPAEDGKMENGWAIHQLQTTANFATSNPLITWYTGGLNFQVEHHLFPNVCHTHYPEISKIVKQLCTEMNITYYEFPSFSNALLSHLSYLKETGRN
jgi:linoleoyl-CoA desaturase